MRRNSVEGRHLISYSRIFLAYLKVGAFSFNAGASEVLLEQIVEKNGWISFEEYTRIISLATLIPGPFHVNLVIATGRALGGFRGSLISVFSFILPGFLVAVLLAQFMRQTSVEIWLKAHPGVATGVLASVAGLLLSVIAKLGRRTLPRGRYWLIVFCLSVLLFFCKIPFVIAIVGSGLIAMLAGIFRKKA